MGCLYILVLSYDIFLTTKKNFLAFRVSSRYKEATAHSLFHGNLSRVLRLTRHDVRGEAEKPSRGAVESGRSISPNEGRLYDTLLNAFLLLRFTGHHFLQRWRFDSIRRAHPKARRSDLQANLCDRDFFELAFKSIN